MCPKLPSSTPSLPFLFYYVPQTPPSAPLPPFFALLCAPNSPSSTRPSHLHFVMPHDLPLPLLFSLPPFFTLLCTPTKSSAPVSPPSFIMCPKPPYCTPSPPVICPKTSPSCAPFLPFLLNYELQIPPPNPALALSLPPSLLQCS